MREMIFVALAIAVTGAWGATPEVGLKSEMQAMSGSLNPEIHDGSDASQWNQTLSIRSLTVASLQLSAGLTLKKRDYTNLVLKDQRQNEVRLPGNSEWLGFLAPLFESGPYRASVTWQGSLSASPFAEQSFGIEAGRGFYNRTIRVDADAHFSDQKRPADFYVDQVFQVRERPRKVQSVELGLAAEQIWSEFTKSRLRFSTREKRWERPRSVGFEAAQGFALGDHWFSQVHLGRYQELRGEALLNDRGYFDAWTGKAELSFEPAYDWLISMSYALGVEYENDPRIQRDIRVGTDQNAVALQYQGKNFRLGLSGALIRSNTPATLTAVAGEFAYAL